MEPTGSTCDVNTIPMAEPLDVLFLCYLCVVDHGNIS